MLKKLKIIKLSLSYLQFFILCDSNTTNERTNLVSSASVILYPKIGSYAIIKYIIGDDSIQNINTL
jgi:hypothetical protein